MKVKEFFRLTEGKVILFILISIIIILTSWYFLLNYYKQFIYPTPISEFSKILTFLFIPLLILSYVISCLIVFILNKIRRKK